MTPSYHSSWHNLFAQYNFDIDDLYETHTPVYPPKEDVFKVFQMPVTTINLVFLGQDPYHGPGQAHGLAFSVPTNIPHPPSLKNIFKELKLEFPERNYNFTTGNLERWQDEEGIFLLNTSLTVEEHKPNSHQAMWKEFTDDVIKYISTNNSKCVFLLLGNYAKEKSSLIKDKSQIIQGVHPSPLSASRGFFGSKIFQQVEDKLNRQINWST